MLPDTSYHSHFSSPTNNHYLDFLVVTSLLDLGSIPGLGRSPGEGKDYPLQYSGLENSMDCLVYEGSSSVTIGIIVNNGLS